MTTECSWEEMQDQESDISDYEVGMSEAAISTSAKSEFPEEAEDENPCQQKANRRLGVPISRSDNKLHCLLLCFSEFSRV